jgi:hypothetical protein
MTIGNTGAWTSKAGLLVKDTGAGKPVTQSAKVKQMLALVGSDPSVLNTKLMDEQKLHRNIKGFDPENVTSKQLGNLSAFLKATGLIPEYKKAIYVLQNLQAYGKGNGTSVPTDKGVTSKA